MKITKYPQSCFIVEEEGVKIVIDVGSFALEKFGVEEFMGADGILITHRHSDHLDAEAIKKIIEGRDVVIFCNQDVCGLLEEEGVSASVLGVDEERDIKGVKVKGVKALHGDLPGGRPKPDVMGFLIGGKVYHMGDCVYMDDKVKAKVVLVPICGTVVMDPKEAKRFVEEGDYEIAIPMHYDNPHYITDVNIFVKEMEGSRVIVKVLKDGESIDI